MKARGFRGSVGAMAIAGLIALAGCGSDDSTEFGAEDDRPTVVASTNILGDVLDELIGDQANVVTILPVGADPHDFQASAQEVEQLLQADALIVNGADFEQGLLDVIDSARDASVPTHEAISAVETLGFADSGDGHSDHNDEDHDDEDHDDEDHDQSHDDEDHDDESHDDEDRDDHDHTGVDPHFFTDPSRMADAVGGMAEFLRAEVDGLDGPALDAAVDSYLTALDDLDAEIENLVAAIPEPRRVLVTNHEVFGYFADRYGFDVVGVVVPGGSTANSASAGELAELAEAIDHEDVPAIFADTSSSSDLAETLAAEVGDVTVVDLYSESLGEPGSDGGTYLAMMRSNATRISAALS